MQEYANMIRCRNWFCARTNNNDYVHASATAAAAGEQHAGNHTSHITQQAQMSSAAAAMTAAAAGSSSAATFAKDAQREQHNFQHQQPQQQQATAATATNASSATAAANAATPSGAAAASHVVTFLDEVPSGSNGVVSTSHRLVSQAEFQASQANDSLDAIDFMDDFGIGAAGQAMLLDESQPLSKNCYRIVMLGSARAGKSSIVSRFLTNRFCESYTPTIEDFHRKLYRIRNEVYQLDILDTSGHHPFPAMRRLSFMTGDLFVLVFSMDSRESFEEVVRLRENILETKWAALNPGSGMKKKSLPKIPMIIAGNKCDKDNKTVNLDEIMGYIAGQDNCCVFVECSARNNVRIDDLFYALFTVANLPLEMAPNHHRRVVSNFGAPSSFPPHTSGGGSRKNALSIKRRFSDACGVVTPNARRPSIRTDLNLMRSKTMQLNEGEGGARSTRRRCSIM